MYSPDCKSASMDDNTLFIEGFSLFKVQSSVPRYWCNIRELISQISDTLSEKQPFTTTIDIQISNFLVVGSTLSRHSTISITYLFRVFPETALNKVLMAWAVRPFLPMTFPISLLATLSSSTTVWEVTISLTCTCSRLSTSDCAIWIRRSFMGLVPFLGSVEPTFVWGR